MKILLLNQTFYPDQMATSQQLTDLAISLSEAGHEVSVVCDQRAYEKRDQVFKKKEIYKGIHIYRVPSTGFGKLRIRYRMIDSLTFDLGLLWRLLWLPRHQTVVCFTSPPLIGVLGALYCLLKGGRCLQWLMDVNPDAAFAVGYLNRHSLLGKTLNAIFELSLKWSDGVVVLDRWMKERIVAHGVTPEKIAVVPPWPVLDMNWNGLDAAIEQFRARNGLTGKFVITYSGNHSVVHPLDTLLEAALKLRDQKDITFVFTGAGLRTKDVSDFKAKHRLENIVQLPLQPRELLKASFGSADLHVVVMGEKVSGLVHTSKIYSILSCGKPFLFIGPGKSHLGDLLRDCPTGFHAEHGETEKLVQHILRAKALTSEEKEKIREESLAFIQSHCMAAQTLDRVRSEVLEAKEVIPEPVSSTP